MRLLASNTMWLQIPGARCFLCGIVMMQVAIVGASVTYNSDYSQDRILVHFIIGTWTIMGATIIFFMQAGFGMLEAGLVQGKNAKNILMKNLLDSAMGAIAYWAVGYAISSGGTDDFIGSKHFFLGEDYTDYYLFFFGFSFACTAATVVSGAMAERTRFSAYMVYTVVITAIVHPVVVYWVWSDHGWMSPFRPLYGEETWWGNGFIDYAGGCAVHVVGGVASLCGAFVLGPRNGRFLRDANGSFDTKWQGHNIALTSLGTFILWFSWSLTRLIAASELILVLCRYPFNAGSVYINLQKSDCSFRGTCADASISSCTGSACTDTFLVQFLPQANQIAGKVPCYEQQCSSTAAAPLEILAHAPVPAATAASCIFVTIQSLLPAILLCADWMRGCVLLYLQLHIAYSLLPAATALHRAYCTTLAVLLA